MKLSRESRYALAAMSYFAALGAGELRQSRQVATAIGAPPPFLAKILGKLARASVLAAVRGGGYALARPASEISVSEVLLAVEGTDLFERCIFWSDECSEANPCVLHPTWRLLRPLVSESMAGISVEDLPRAGGYRR